MNIYIGGPVEVSDMQGPAPSGFHVPLYSEWQAILDAGVSLGAWSSSNGTNFSTYLKMPMAGYRDYSDLGFYGRMSYGHYWDSTPYNARNAYSLFFVSNSIYQDYNSRSYGYSVRCVKNSPTIPTASWNVLYQGSGSAGIFHNSTDGLISLSSDGTTWYTLMDKNLGATTVYNYGDTLTESNCGKIYQRGNNYGFSGDVNYDISLIQKSSTQVNVTGYGPGNYYSSSTWITNNPRQSSANDGNNLRGGVSQQSGTKSVEVQNIYIGEYGWKPGSNTLAYYPLETDTNDYSGNNRNGTNNGVTFSNGVGVFNGSSYVSLGTGSWTNIQTNMTISVWFKWNGGGSKDNMVVAKSQYYAPGTGYSNYAFYVISIHEEDRYLMAGFYNQSDFNAHPLNFRTTGGGSPTLGPVSQSNKWYHVVITNDGTTKKAYIDGTLVATETNTSTSSTQSVDTRIGSAVRYNYDSYFNGNISKVIFEDKTWSAQEVSDYYNQTKSNYGL